MTDKLAQEMPIVTLEKRIYALEPSFSSVAVDRGVNFVREAEFAIQAISASDYIMKIALSNPDSVRNAVTNIAAIGISLNPARKQAYLVPRKGGIVLSISYMGLLDLAVQSGAILWGHAEIVYASDTFTINGPDAAPTHTRQPFSTDRGDMVGVYVVVKTKDGDYLTDTMTAADVFAIRDRSDAWQAFIKDKKKCPWATDEGEMVKKTVIKRASKTWPKGEDRRLDTAIQYLNTQGGEGIRVISDDAEPVDQPTDFGLTKARYKVIRQVANATLQAFNEGDEIGAYGEAGAIEDNDEKLALWAILKPHPAVRSCLKRLREEESAAQARLDKERTIETA